MDDSNVFQSIRAHRFIPVVAIEDLRTVTTLADALIEGGLPILEITFRTDLAADAISLLRRQRPELLVGAGTLLTVAEVDIARESGAQFGVSPGLHAEIVDRAAHHGLPYIPGVATAGEIQQALSIGCRVLKFFPAATLGGTATLKALWAPFRHTGVSFIPTGGVTDANCLDYLSLDYVAAVGGSWIASAEDLAVGRWDDIRRRSSWAASRFARSDS